MGTAAIIALILSEIPNGITAFDAIERYIRQSVADRRRRDFLLGCTAMCRDLLIENSGLSWRDQQRWCADAIKLYGINMGEPVDVETLRSLGVMFTEG